MLNSLLQIAQSATVSVLALGLNSSLISAGILQGQQPGSGSVFVAGNQTSQIIEQQIEDKAGKVDQYFKDHEMPLFGYGREMVVAAATNGLDWRLLPAIAVRESSGGKESCHNNPFGWGSCKIKFKNYSEAIATVAAHLGGNKESTADFYQGASTREILRQYNGTVMPTYVSEVLTIMKNIGDK